MIVNELKLPNSFVELLQKGTLHAEVGSWHLREEVDSFGNHLESELGEIYKNEDALARETRLLPKGFEPNDYYGEPSEYQNEPGFINDIIDFSRIVCFGISGDGAPFCFDYRDNSKEPSVIWWNDVYWRRIAPNFDSFIDLFKLNNDV